MAASMGSRFCYRFLQNIGYNSVKRHCFCNVNKRTYARGMRRDIQRVMTIEDEHKEWANRVNLSDPKKNPYVQYESGDAVQQSMTERYNETAKQRKLGNKKKTPNKQHPKGKGEDILTYTRPDKSVVKYTKLEDGDKRFGHMIMSAKSRREREKTSTILLEGYRLIQDALNAGAKAKCLYFSDRQLLDNLTIFDQDVEVYKVLYRHFKLWADTQSPSGIMAIFEKPRQGECPSPIDSSLPMTLICDNVRDPGNMGTLIRTAVAVGCRRIITTKGCVDVWEPKVLRAGMGSHFHIPILAGIPWELIINYVSENTQVFIADTKKNLEKVARIIPDLLDSDGPPIANDKLASYREEFPLKSDEDLAVDAAYLDKDHLKQYSQVPMNYVDYSNIKCTEKDVTVLIGGETTGVTEAAKKFAFDGFGQCVTIPMSPAVNSLNSAIAAGVILYEIRKQLASQK